LVGAPTLACATFMQAVSNQAPVILERLQHDWVPHPDISLLDCFCEVDARVEVHLNPCFLGPRLAQGLRKAAGDILLKYQRALNCIPLTVADLRPAGSQYGAVVGDGPYVHFLASFKAVGFAPKKDGWILGRIATEQSTGKGMNVSVLKLLNTFVRKDSLPKELSYNPESRAWLKGSTQLSENHIVLMKVSQLEVDAARIGEMGIGMHGYIESTAHIRKQKIVRESASNLAPNVGAAPSPAKQSTETPATSSVGRGEAESTTPNSAKKHHKDIPIAEATPVKQGIEESATPRSERKKRKEISTGEASPVDRGIDESATPRSAKKSRKETRLDDTPVQGYADEAVTPRSGKKNRTEQAVAANSAHVDSSTKGIATNEEEEASAKSARKERKKEKKR